LRIFHKQVGWSDEEIFMKVLLIVK